VQHWVDAAARGMAARGATPTDTCNQQVYYDVTKHGSTGLEVNVTDTVCSSEVHSQQ
jgi:hypothetical protein